MSKTKQPKQSEGLSAGNEGNLTPAERWLAKIKRNPAVSALIVLAAVMSGITAFTKSFDDIKRIFIHLLPEKQTTTVMHNHQLKPLNNSLDTNIHTLENVSDGISMQYGAINVAVGINNKENSQLNYAIQSTANEQYKIGPSHPYLTTLQKRETIDCRFAKYAPEDFQLPTIDFKVTNNSDELVFFNKAVFHFKKSVADNYPILLIRGISNYMDIPLMNIGWGKVYDCKLTFNITPEDSPLPSAYFSLNKKFKYTMDLGDFADEPINTKLGVFFAKEGVDTLAVQSSGVNYTLKALGRFTKGKAFVYGYIDYKAIDANGHKIPVHLPFASEVSFKSPGAFGTVPSTKTYQVSMVPEGKDYTCTVDIFQQVKPKDSDHFSISLYAPQSSAHDFDLTLAYNDNKQFRLPNIHLDYFLSRLDTVGFKKIPKPRQ